MRATIIVVALGSLIAAADAHPLDAKLAPAPIVLPSLLVTTNTDGTSTIDGGLSIKWGIAKLWDVTLEPSARTTASNGVANLFSAGSGAAGASKPWAVGIQATLSLLPDVTATPAQKKEYQDAMLALERKILDQCNKQCAASGASGPACDIWNEVGLSATLLTLAPDPKRRLLDACDTTGQRSTLNEQAAKATNKEDRNLRAQLPGLEISAALAVGAQDFSYLDNSATDGTLVPAVKTFTNVQSAVLMSWLSKRGVSLEVPVTFSSMYTASPNTVQWCSPAGMVPRPGAPGITDAASSCSEGQVGGPTHNLVVSANVLAGWVDWRKQIWRGSGGLSFRWTSNTPAGDQARIGAVFPIYLSFAKVRAGDDAQYHGLVRLTPAFYWTHDATGWNATALLSLELLGQRSLFGARAKEWF